MAGRDLFDCDLRGLDLANEIFNDANLAGANLAGVNLAGAKMKNGDFEDANFAGANLSGADMRFSDWDYADFSGANLSDADLREADAEYVVFTDTTLHRVRLDDTGIGGSDLTNADLVGATGQPNDGPSAVWSNTICPDGITRSTNCYS